MTRPYELARNLLFRLDAETAHKLTLRALKAGLVPPVKAVDDPALAVTLWDRRFLNPVGLSAGFDKNAEVIAPMLGLGFGFVEAGTVTPRPQDGNPRPRVFRDLKTKSVINAMGFPNDGMAAFKQNFESFLSRKPHARGIIGINIGMNKGQSAHTEDYKTLVRSLGPLADYLTVNISSPNTPGLRDLQRRDHLLPLLAEIMAERRRSCGSAPPPLLVKLAPDLTEAQQEELAGTLAESGVDGIILTNTTLARPDTLPAAFAARKGGLSGPPLRDRSTAVIANFYRLTEGKIPLVGAGGIAGARDAYDKIRAGASLVQLYTALVFQGPGIVRDINLGLAAFLKRDGFAHIGEAVGAAHHRKPQNKKASPKKTQHDREPHDPQRTQES